MIFVKLRAKLIYQFSYIFFQCIAHLDIANWNCDVWVNRARMLLARGKKELACELNYYFFGPVQNQGPQKLLSVKVKGSLAILHVPPELAIFEK